MPKKKASAAAPGSPAAKKAAVAKAAALASDDANEAKWEWRNDDGKWQPFAEEDAATLEKARGAEGPKGRFSTTHFSFNTEAKTVYMIDFERMTQTNLESKVSRALRRNGKGSAAGKVTWQVALDGGKWTDLAAQDAQMLERQYLLKGPKSSLRTAKFTFNKGYDTMYEVDFAKMEQRNEESGAMRKIRRKVLGGRAAEPGARWEWWGDDGKWHAYDGKDVATIEGAFATESNSFFTKDLTWNAGYDSLYLFMFDVMTQVNCESHTSRKMRRIGASGAVSTGVGGDAGDAGYVAAMADGSLHHGAAKKATTTTKKKKVAKGSSSSSSSSASSSSSPAAPFDETTLEVVAVPAGVADAQRALGPQSLRRRTKDFGPMVSKDPHGRHCFELMLENEAKLCGEWAVFYHSYSAAALLYEVQAAIANVLFRFKSQFAALPRLLYEPFLVVPDAPAMLERFPAWPDRDHNHEFRGVGLCATSGLLAPDSEAPPKSVFLSGYSVGPLKGVLARLLAECGVPPAKVPALEKRISKLAEEAGLDMTPFGGKPCKSGRRGHMLQIFMRRSIVDRFCYGSFAYGVPDKKRPNLAAYLAKDAALQGQVRITANPHAFLKVECVRMFSFAADPTYFEARKDFQTKLVAALDPVLGDEDTRKRAVNGIFSGKPPAWWTPEDQGDTAAAFPHWRYVS